MTVYELIQEFAKYPPDTEVEFLASTHAYTVSIEDADIGRDFIYVPGQNGVAVRIVDINRSPRMGRVVEFKLMEVG